MSKKKTNMIADICIIAIKISMVIGICKLGEQAIKCLKYKEDEL